MRDAIPEEVKRQVRQRCNFGCVICGLPLYEYEHMLGWANVKRHIASEITLLCDRHHREKTSGLLPNEIVLKANEEPFNLKGGKSQPYNLYYYGDTAEITIGNVIFIARDEGNGTKIVPIFIDSLPIISFTLIDKHFHLSMFIYNEKNELILHINENQLVFKIDVWDIQLVGNTFTIRQAKRNILIEIKFETPNKIFIKRGKFLYNGVEVNIKPDGLFWNDNESQLSNITFETQSVLSIGRNNTNIQSLFNVDVIRKSY